MPVFRMDTGHKLPLTNLNSQPNQSRRLPSKSITNHLTPFAEKPNAEEYRVVDRSCKSSCFEISFLAL